MRIKNPRTSRFKESLYRVVNNYYDNEFSLFSDDYWNGYGLGTYWIGTDDEDYFITKPLEREYSRQGKLIAYISPEYLNTKYAVEIDASRMSPYEDIKDNKTISTNTIKIFRPDLIHVNGIYSVPKAIEVFKYNVRYLPRTKFELKEFWDYSKERLKLENEGKKRKTVRRRKEKKD